MIGGYLARYFDERRDKGKSAANSGPVRESPPDASHAELLRPGAASVLLALGMSVPRRQPALATETEPPDSGEVSGLREILWGLAPDGREKPSLPGLRDAHLHPALRRGGPGGDQREGALTLRSVPPPGHWSPVE